MAQETHMNFFDIDKFIDIIDKTPRTKRRQALMAFYKTISSKGRFFDEKNPASKFAFEMISKNSKYKKATRQKAANGRDALEQWHTRRTA